MTSGPSVADLNRVTDPDGRRVTGAIRRMAIKVTSQVLWQLIGYKVGARTETRPAEPFTGIGFYSRPPANGKPEAIVVFAAGAKSPAVVATRDEKTRAAIAGGIAEGETIVYSGAAIVYVRNNTVEIRLANGVAVPLATKADVDALIATFNAHTHLVAALPSTGLPPPTIPTLLPTGLAAPSVGTSVLRGQ